MSRPTVRIHDIKTDEVIDREMNDEEFTEYEARELEKQAERTEAEAKAAKRAELLDRLGITEEEARILLG